MPNTDGFCDFQGEKMSDSKIGKADLVNAVAKETGIPKTKCSELLTSLVNQIQAM